MRHFKEWRNYVIFVLAWLTVIMGSIELGHRENDATHLPHKGPPFDTAEMIATYSVIAFMLAMIGVGIWVLVKAARWIKPAGEPFSVIFVRFGKLLRITVGGVVKGYRHDKPSE